ncbi:MAG: DUF4450 domain-containing protein [Verrucomicrobia bacterium]|nr:DUF4450 domain-containing protein [Verrucomicrobiota bacterium]
MAHSPSKARPAGRVKSPAPTARPKTKERASRYTARDGAIIGRNVGRYFNRPLYVANTNAFVLAGDNPVLRFASGDTVHGTLRVGLARGNRVRWLHEAADITTEYRPAHVRWIVREGALTVALEVVALADETGFAAKAQIKGAKPGDRLVWSYAGAKIWPEKNLNWEMDPHREPKLMPEIFEAAWCAGNVAQVASGVGTFSLAPSADAAAPRTVGRCVAAGTTLALATVENGVSAVAGHSEFAGGTAEISWAFKRVAAGEAGTAGDPAERFAAGLARSAALAARIVVETPEPRLDAAAGLLAAALDGVWYPPVYRHGAMLWNSRYPGWRTVFGGTVLGWHERVKTQAKFYTASQVTSSENTSMEADPKLLLTMPAANARFYGRGRIKEDQSIYNMQSQFFDQLIHAWRWTGDAELEAVLRPALELHLEWLRDCFERDGLYESYINTWPTDSVWFAGGGATEETSYAYRAYGAARELARRAGDKAAAQRHAKTLARIRTAFRRKLWIKEKGHAGLYREQEGLQRLHDDPWLYSLFLPVDAGLVDAEQAAESLRYAETGLQNDRMPCGGRQVWTSNFVPGIWSVRELWPGDNCHLALAYFQAGLGEDAWEVFRGTLLHTAFDFLVPGDFGAPPGGTDFGDSTHMAARTLVEGLFGFAPERSRGVVRLTPQFPASWDRARLRTPEVNLRFSRIGAVLTLEVELTAAAKLEIRLPVCARGVKRVAIDGRPVRWTAEAGFERTWVSVTRPKTTRLTLTMELSEPVAGGALGPVRVKGEVGQRITARLPQGWRGQTLSDPQGVFEKARIGANSGVITGQIAGKPGAHTVFVRGKFGQLPQIVRLQAQVTDSAAERAAAAKLPGRIPAGPRARWRCVDLSAALNGDIRTIYQQKYLSPRPATISARIGTDGYTPWTFNYWSSYPPVIKLDGVPALLAKADTDGETRLQTPQGVPFAWPGEARNVAFTSRWDNWPGRVTVPVGCAGDAVWFLVCGSTNPMQGRIANAVLRLRYAGGSAAEQTETLELVPPVNYWNLSPIRPVITAPGQESRFDYVSPVDRYCLPKVLPQTVQLGENCRAMLLGWRLRPGAVLRDVTLETLSAEVVVGLMGLTVMGAR